MMRHTVVHARPSRPLFALLLSCAAAVGCAPDSRPLADAELADTASTELDGLDDAASTEVAGDTPSDSGTTTVASRITLLEPTGVGVTNGLVVVVIAPTDDEPERVVDAVRLDVDGATVFRGALLPDRLLLDTAFYTGTSLRLEAHGVIGGVAHDHAVDLTVSNRPYRLVALESDAYAYADGETVALDVTLSHVGADLFADFSALDSAFDPDSQQVAPLGDGRFRITYPISSANLRPDGLYRVPIRAAYPGWPIAYDALELRLLNRPVLPIRIANAIEVLDTRPDPFGWTAPPPSLTSNTTLVTGGSLALRVDFRDVPVTSDVVGVIVAFDETHGFLQIPLENSAGLEDLRVSLRQYAPTEAAPPTRLTLAVALVDRRGHVSSYVRRPLDVLAVGAGDLQISVSWDTPTDVDLHVTGPGSTPDAPPCTVFYANKTCLSGGQLDLDSNPACNIDGVNNENVFWDTTRAAPGDYQIALRYWSDCGCCAARYTVSVVNCGETTTYEGILLQGTSGASSPLREIGTVSPRDCGRAVVGHARYEDRVMAETGARVSTQRPARHALVEVRRADDGTVIGSGRTDAAGDYRVSFPHAPGEEVYVALVSRTDPADGVRHVEVLEHPYRRDPFEVTSPPFVPPPGAQNSRVPSRADLVAREGDGSGAFNILDQVVTGYDLVRRMTGRDLGALRVFWTQADDGGETAYCTRPLYDAGGCIEPRSVTIQGFEDDPDQYDDQVILRAFFGFALERASRNDSPGGPIDGRRVDPRVAWAEGAAIFFATDVVGRSTYTDSRPGGVALVTDLASPWSPFARGVDGERVSPQLVGTVLHGLGGDGAAPEATARRRQAVYDVIFNRLRTPNLPDRGPTGVDLTDFLDGLICRGYAGAATLEPLLTARGYVYDFDGPETCP